MKKCCLSNRKAQKCNNMESYGFEMALLREGWENCTNSAVGRGELIIFIVQLQISMNSDSQNQLYFVTGAHEEYSDFGDILMMDRIQDQYLDQKENTPISNISKELNLPSSDNSTPKEDAQTDRTPETPINPPSRRTDQKSKNLSQNVSSYIKTILPKILCKDPKRKKNEVKEIRLRLAEYLKKYKVENNQLVLLFAYLFMLMEKATVAQFKEMRQKLESYFGERLAKSSSFEEGEREIFVEKLTVNKRLVAEYFDGGCQELDMVWIKTVCSVLFKGRQKNTINTPLKILETIQQGLTGDTNEFLNYENSYLIQGFSGFQSGNQ